MTNKKIDEEYWGVAMENIDSRGHVHVLGVGTLVIDNIHSETIVQGVRVRVVFDKKCGEFFLLEPSL